MTQKTDVVTIATYLREQNFNERIWDTLDKHNQHIVMQGYIKQAENILDIINKQDENYCSCGHKWDRHEQLLNRSWRCLDCQCRDKMRNAEFDTDRR